MQPVETVHCPNCGSFAERRYSPTQQRIHTACDQCDYLLVTCAWSGRVFEAYAPGIPAGTPTIQPAALTQLRSSQLSASRVCR